MQGSIRGYLGMYGVQGLGLFVVNEEMRKPVKRVKVWWIRQGLLAMLIHSSSS